jgi:hypothetical protein
MSEKFQEPLYRDKETGELKTQGELVEESESEEQSDKENENTKREIEQKKHMERDGLESPSRRNFIKGVVATGVGLAVPSYIGKENVPEQEELPEQRPDRKEKPSTEHRERMPGGLLPHEQLVYGKIQNLTEGLNEVYDEEYMHFAYNAKGQSGMETATDNLSELDMKRFITPFLERGLPQQLAYMIAIQETRARNTASWAGAVGMTGIMPHIAEHYGYAPDDVRDPYIASEITAKYLDDERKRFGDNIDMLLFAYNGGGLLFGFTEATPKHARTPANFYNFMQEKINTAYEGIEDAGYYVYKVDKRATTFIKMSELFDIPVEEIEHENPSVEPTQIHLEDKIKIPIEHATERTWRQVFRKEFETLYYAPEVKAKYNALRDLGLTSRIEKDLDTKTHSLG